MKQRSRFPIRPTKHGVKRIAILANSREGESLDDFMARMKDNKSTIGGVQVEPKGGYRKKFIPRYNEERWVTTLEEKNYAV